MPVDIDEENVVPFSPPGRPRFDATHINTVLRQRSKQPVPSARIIRIHGGHEQRGFIVAARREQFATDDKKPRRVVRAILDIGDQLVQCIDFGGRISGDGGRTGFIPCAPCCSRSPLVW